MTEGKVIVVGGGIGGLSTAKQLAKAGVKVTLVSPLEYWDYSISAARCIVEPEAVTKHNFTPPLDKICEFIKCNFVQGSVTEVRADGVTLANGDVLTAGAVVVAIGGSYAGAAIWKARADETSAQARPLAYSWQGFAKLGFEESRGTSRAGSSVRMERVLKKRRKKEERRNLFEIWTSKRE